MTVKELVENLQNLIEEDKDNATLEVMVAYDYGDHCHTMALQDFNEATIEVPKKTAYSSTGLAISEDDDCDENEDVERVVVLQ